MKSNCPLYNNAIVSLLTSTYFILTSCIRGIFHGKIIIFGYSSNISICGLCKLYKCYFLLQSSDVSVFETNIRFIGGLLSCFALTGDVVFKDKAQQIADKLLPAFHTPTGIPNALVNFKTGVCFQLAIINFGSINSNRNAEVRVLSLRPLTPYIKTTTSWELNNNFELRTT